MIKKVNCIFKKDEIGVLSSSLIEMKEEMTTQMKLRKK